MPVATIGVTAWRVYDGTVDITLVKEDTAGTFAVWPILCSIISLLVLVFYVGFLLPEIEGSICEQFVEEDEEEGGEENEAGKEGEEGEEGEEGDKEPNPSRYYYDYRGENGEKYFREAGSGPYRIGKPITTRLDIYSMLFVSSVRPEYIHHFKTKEEKRQEAIDALVDGPAEEPAVTEAKVDRISTNPDGANPPGDQNEEDDVPLTKDKVAFRKLKLRLEYDKNNYLSQTFAIWCFQVSLIFFIVGDPAVIPSLTNLQPENPS